MLQDYEKHAKVLKKVSPFRPKICPLRLLVNVYTGCVFQYVYCYARAYIRGLNKPDLNLTLKIILEDMLRKPLKLG